MTRRQLRLLLVMVLLVLMPRSTMDIAPNCEFSLEFARLKAAIDAAEGLTRVGACRENQRVAANGDVEQKTRGGLLVWHKQENVSSFTDGQRTWAIGPRGLQVRLNSEPFDWAVARSYRGVALGGRRADADLRAWIDAYGTLGHGRSSYDHWLRIGRPRDAAGKPLTDSLAVALARLERTSTANLEEKRRQMIDFLWGDEGLPLLDKPDSIITGFYDPRFSSLENLKSLDQIIINMDFMINSIAYLFHPKQSNSQLIIYHHGHLEGFFLGLDTIRFFLRHGYTVAAFSMPLHGMNSRPSIQVHGESIALTEHGDFKLLESATYSPLKFFLDPIVVFLDYALAEHAYDQVAMVGLSGGGWTATLAAALDTRIERSYPVAGTQPLYFEAGRDYEQEDSRLYDLVNYLELYVLGTYGGERRQIQVLNEYDPCCFSGTNHLLYQDEVARTAQRVGNGDFRVFLDSTHREHKISSAALWVILKDLQSP